MPHNSAKVEIIPWLHHIDALAHEDVVRYVRALPKNSVVAIELQPGEDLSAEMGLLTVSRPSEYEQVLVELIGKSMWSFLEVLHECRKRNIKLVGIETPVSRAKGERGRRALKWAGKVEQPSKEMLAANVAREQSFAKQVQTTLWKFKGAMLSVLTGFEHATNLKRELGKRGIKASVNTGIFTQKGKIERALQSVEDKRKAIQSGRMSLAMQAHLSCANLLLNVRKEPFTKAQGRITMELRRRAEMQSKRTERRLAEKKNGAKAQKGGFWRTLRNRFRRKPRPK